MNFNAWGVAPMAVLIACTASLVVAHRKAPKGWHLAVIALLVVACTAQVYVTFFMPVRPQLDLRNDGAEPILVGVPGELEMHTLVPAQEVSCRYDLGASVVVHEVTPAGPGAPQSFALPEREDAEIVRAAARVRDGKASVDFGGSGPK